MFSTSVPSRWLSFFIRRCFVVVVWYFLLVLILLIQIEEVGQFVACYWIEWTHTLSSFYHLYTNPSIEEEKEDFLTVELSFYTPTSYALLSIITKYQVHTGEEFSCLMWKDSSYWPFILKSLWRHWIWLVK